MKRLWIALVLTITLMAGASSHAYKGSPESQAAKQVYKQGNYTEAIERFSQVIQKEKSNTYALFYLGLSLAREHQYEDARKVFEKVIELESTRKLQTGQANEKMLAKARKNIAVMANLAMKSRGEHDKASKIIRNHAGKKDNYLAFALPQGKVIHWDRMPLKVYISEKHPPGWSYKHLNAVKNAMGIWERASRGKIRFTTVSHPASADIVVRWKPAFTEHNRIGVNAFRHAGGNIVQSDVMLGLRTTGGRPLTAQELAGSALHEFGHALGIQGHSPYTDDIMFFSTNPTQGRSLSSRDVRTIQLLYEQTADITHSGKTSVRQSKQAYELLQRASKVLTSQPEQALKLARQAREIDPENPDARKLETLASFNTAVAHMRQGNQAARQKNYYQARIHFQQAVVLFQSVSRSPDAPDEAQANLQRARHNLQMVSR